MDRRFFVLPFFVLGILIISLMSTVSASHLTTNVSIPEGTSVPGCETTNECFIPFEAIVDVGGDVVWSNDDTAAHTVTSGNPTDGPSGVFDSSLFLAGTTFSHTFEDEGTFPYFCLVHPWMEGIVTVVSEEAATCDGANTTIVGTENNDILFGGDGPDVIHGLGGNDIIFGLAGDDIICGGDGNDTIYGNSGKDRSLGNEGNDVLFSGDGNDISHGGKNKDVIYGGDGNDKLSGNGGIDTIYGGDGDDVLNGNSGNDVIYGGVGVDVIMGGSGDDQEFPGNSISFTNYYLNFADIQEDDEILCEIGDIALSVLGVANANIEVFPLKADNQTAVSGEPIVGFRLSGSSLEDAGIVCLDLTP